MNADTLGTTAGAQLSGPVPSGPAEDWDWEAFRIDGKLYLYCYLRETVLIPLTSGPGL